MTAPNARLRELGAFLRGRRGLARAAALSVAAVVQGRPAPPACARPVAVAGG